MGMLTGANRGFSDMITFYNQWVWQVPFSSYASGQKTVEMLLTGQSQFIGLDCNSQASCFAVAAIEPEVPLLLEIHSPFSSRWLRA